MESIFKILAGPSMSGKTYSICKEILKRAYENPNEKFLIIIPDQVGNAYEKKLIEMNNKLYSRPGFMNIDVLGFNRFAFRVFEDMCIESSSVLEEYEKSMLIRVVLGRIGNELELFKSSIDKMGFTGELKSLISELIQYDIEPEDIRKLIEEGGSDRMNPALLAKLKDVSRIYEEFLRLLGERGSGLSEERLKILSRNLSQEVGCKVTDNVTFYFDEFRGYTPDQLKVIKALTKRAKEMNFGICIETDILKKGIRLKEHDLFYQSSETIRQLQETIGYKPEIIYFKRRNRDPKALMHLEKSLLRFPVSERTGIKDELTGNHPSLRIFTAKDPESEIRLVAQDIRELVKSGYRYKDIVVATGDIESFDKLADSIFREYDIPLFSDYNRKLRKNPFTDAIVKALEICDRDYDYNSVFGYVKTGVLEIEDVHARDSLENYVLRTGIRGRSLWHKKLSSGRRKLTEEEKVSFEKMENVRKCIVDSLASFNDLEKGEHLVRDYIKAVRKLVEELRFEEKIERAVTFLEGKEMYSDAQAMKGIMNVLEKLLSETEDFLGDVQMNIHDFSEILQSGINEITIGVIPPTLDTVTAIDPARSRVLDTKVLFFVNVNDGVIPAATRNGGIISDKDKLVIERMLEEQGGGKHFADFGIEKNVSELFTLYQLMSKPTEMLNISYTASNINGEALEPSYMVGRVARLFPELKVESREVDRLKGTIDSDRVQFILDMRSMLEMLHGTDGDISSAEDKIRAIYEEKLKVSSKYVSYGGKISDEMLYGFTFENRAGKISQETLKNINLKLSVSKIEKYMSCPYSYFLQYVIGLQERPEKKIEHYDIGNIIHTCLEHTMEAVIKEHDNNWNALDDGVLSEMAQNYLDEAWNEYEAESVTEKKEALTETIHQNLRHLVKTTIGVLKKHIVSGELLPDRMEQTFKAEFVARRPDGEEVPITVVGKIDRLDMKEEDGKTYIRVIDYKTGSQSFSPREIKEGTAVQLAVYTGIVRDILQKKLTDKEVIPAGMYYYHVDEPVVEMVTPGKLKKFDGDLEKAAKDTLENELKLNGVSNDDPNTEGDSYIHRMLNLHDSTLVSNESGRVLGDSSIIPVGVNKDGEYKSNTIVTDTDGFGNVCDYSMKIMKIGAEKILSGNFEKRPINYVGKMVDACGYCSYQSVCRFNKNAGSERKIPKAAGTIRDQIRSLEVAQDDKVEIKNSKFE